MMVQFDVKRVKSGSESFMVSFDFNKTPVTQIADYIIIAASKHNTSDIHFDPRDEGMMVRFRIDGDCQDYTFVPKAYEKNLTTRLKLLANMNITESRLPQDGAIKGEFGGTYLDMRVSALPLNTGEKIVIRILDYTRSLQGIDSLGFHPKNLEKIKRMMGLPNGIILTTGATGSGKSTTTYSILQGLNKPETNVITVEAPIEMNIEGINQVQVNAEIGLTFAAALRSILRQDPNVILIGEIRDSETAQIAVRASITGHLVLSTIHTNNALATVERLLDMNVERYLLSTALSGIISQRLAKMLCTECKIKRPTTKYEKKVFKKYMQMDVDEVWDANPKGCENCRRGYHGRIAVHEVLELTEELKAALSNENLEKEDLAKKVYGSGTITMLQDALIKCLEGKTSFGEVYKTIEIENEDDDNYENEIETEIKEAIKTEEEPKVSDDLLETVVQEGHAEVFVPTMITAAAFSDKDDSQEAQENNNVQPAQNADTNGAVQQNTAQVIIPPKPPIVTQSTSSTEVTVPQTPIVSQPDNAPEVIVQQTQESVTPALAVAQPVQNQIMTNPVPIVSQTQITSEVNANQAPVASTPISYESVQTSAPALQVINVENPGIQQPVVTTGNQNLNPVSPQVIVQSTGGQNIQNTSSIVSSPIDMNALQSMQAGTVSFINNQNIPLSNSGTNLPIINNQQNTTAPMPTVGTTTQITPTVLPTRNDTVIEALPASVTTLTPTNTYIRALPVENVINNSQIQISPTQVAQSNAVGANNFSVQQPLMPTNLNN